MLALTSARALLEHGLSGIALLDLPSAHEKAKSAIDTLRKDFPAAKILAETCDVTDAKGMQDVVQKARDQLGYLTILCCFAGMVYCETAEDTPIDDWKKVLDVNTTGSWISAQTVGRYASLIDRSNITDDINRHMISSGRGGKIVFISSISGHRVNYPQPQAAYNVSKASILHMRRNLAAEWTRHGIRVNSISPGYMDTVLNEGDQLEPWRHSWADRNPMRRMGSPQELTGPLVFLCSDIGGGYVNGTDLVVDGRSFYIFP